MGTNKDLLVTLQTKLEAHLHSCSLAQGDAVVTIASSEVLVLFPILKYDADLAFDFLVSVTAVDWLEQRKDRFEVVYHLMSLRHLHRLRVKVLVSGQGTELASISDLWRAADLMEREVWDMFGLRFTGHPDLRRILMYDEFVGHPLRKDYPVEKKQPRVPYRHAEVRNCSSDMKRSPLDTWERSDE